MVRWGILFFVAGYCIAPALAASDDTPSYFLDKRVVSLDGVRFFASSPMQATPPQESWLDILVVYTAHAGAAHPRGSYFLVKQRMTCATHTAFPLSYSAYGVDGTLLNQSMSIPSDETAYAPPSGILQSLRQNCDVLLGKTITVQSSVPGSPVVFAKSVADAVAIARQRESELGSGSE